MESRSFLESLLDGVIETPTTKNTIPTPTNTNGFRVFLYQLL
jgi:hypothetical protein